MDDERVPDRHAQAHARALLGYKVEICNNGKQALSAVRERTPKAFDLVITDMVMPEMSGDEMAGVNCSSLRPDLPIIMCTGYTENMTEEKALSLGIRAFATQTPGHGEACRC